MAFSFPPVPPPSFVSEKDWRDWKWQMRASLRRKEHFQAFFHLSKDEEEGFLEHAQSFQVRVTPYYASLASRENHQDPLRRILMPHKREREKKLPQKHTEDPLGERNHSPVPRIVHRYPDRVLFLITDHCGIYCRYCTRKHFTGGEKAFIKKTDYEQALNYLKQKKGVREVILSGGDPLTVSNPLLERTLKDLRKIRHIDIIRIGTRMPVVNPMRIQKDLIQTLKSYHPIFIMTHFNHPRELTELSAAALSLLVDHGFPIFNQMVLLSGINNHEAIVQALARRLLYLRVKPYYMFQCDPSEGTEHLRTSVENSLKIQRALWGRLSGLAFPQLSLDIPGGGGKVGLIPNFILSRSKKEWSFQGWDGVQASYINPQNTQAPPDIKEYEQEWHTITDGFETKIRDKNI